MPKTKKIITALCLIGIGAGALWGTQFIMHKTSSPEFCVSCHSMSQPKEEWESSNHFSNAKGIRAECADCHVPSEGWHYVKAKFIALKDLWYERQIGQQRKIRSTSCQISQNCVGRDEGD